MAGSNVESRKICSRGFREAFLMKKYPGTLVTTKLDKSSAIFIRYPIINSLASDRLPIFLPINRHRQPNDKPLDLKNRLFRCSNNYLERCHLLYNLYAGEITDHAVEISRNFNLIIICLFVLSMGFFSFSTTSRFFVLNYLNKA